jgi:hypothetical protein
MYQVQATVAMEQQQIRFDIIKTAAAGTCFGTGSRAMSTHTDLITPEPHTRTSKRILKDRQAKTFYIEDFTRSSYKNFL